MSMNRRSGKVHWMGVTTIVALVLVLGLIFKQGDTPSAGAARFMKALAAGDVDQLTENSFLDGLSEQELKQQWTTTVKDYLPHFLFLYTFTTEETNSDKLATVKMRYRPELDNDSGYERNLGVQLELVNGRWKVDIGSIDREIVPALPTTLNK